MFPPPSKPCSIEPTATGLRAAASTAPQWRTREHNHEPARPDADGSVSPAVRADLPVPAWGGRRLADLLAAPLPGHGPIGEAWVLSDRDDYASRVADGPLKGQTIGHLMEQSPEQLLGMLAGRFSRFPLLLKFLDVREMLSLQVHPSPTRLRTKCERTPSATDRHGRDVLAGARPPSPDPIACLVAGRRSRS